jgi:hypothetical protein
MQSDARKDEEGKKKDRRKRYICRCNSYSFKKGREKMMCELIIGRESPNHDTPDTACPSHTFYSQTISTQQKELAEDGSHSH